MLENSTQNKKEHRLVLVVAYAEFNKNLNENALKFYSNFIFLPIKFQNLLNNGTITANIQT